MARWTPDQSALLSLLLDDVTGSKELVAIRQDFCRLSDCIKSNMTKCLIEYFTGSQAEGLNLPGSDQDFMMELNRFGINDLPVNHPFGMFEFKVVQSLHESPTSEKSVLYLCTEHTPPGFALLRCIKLSVNPLLHMSIEYANGERYISSNLMAANMFSFNLADHPFYPSIPEYTKHFKAKRQGPSFEHCFAPENLDPIGTDYVPCIHCAFWPNDASEWVERPRPFGWPTTQDVSSIVNFGCHLVAIGHHNSRTRSLEWRISFSLAERLLVWSFNHVQIQCYAIMKIILKEFVKVNCNPHNQVLCSYFIKTFLFWEYERNNLSFWQENNLRECIKYLLIEFHKCLNEGVIRHFFFSRFNLLSVKLTTEAKIELLQLFDIIIQSDISIIRECKTLKNIWSKILSADRNQCNLINNERRRHFLQNDKGMMNFFSELTSIFSIKGHIIGSGFVNFSFQNVITHVWSLPCKTSLKSLVIKQLLLQKHCMEMNSLCLGNKNVYGNTQDYCS